MPDFALAGPFVHAPIKADSVKEREKPPAPDPRKLAEALPIVTAAKHCIALEGIISQPYQLVEAYNEHPDIDNLPKDIDEAGKQKALLYMMGRPDIADFGFLIPDIWRTANRAQRTEFNALVTLRLDEIIGFKQGGYPFAGNCKTKLESDITKDKNGVEHVRVVAPLAFDVKEVTLTYLMLREPGYNWQIDDLLVNNVGVANFINKHMSAEAHEKGFDAVIGGICKKSSLPTLRCR